MIGGFIYTVNTISSDFEVLYDAVYNVECSRISCLSIYYQCGDIPKRGYSRTSVTATVACNTEFTKKTCSAQVLHNVNGEVSSVAKNLVRDSHLLLNLQQYLDYEYSLPCETKRLAKLGKNSEGYFIWLLFYVGRGCTKNEPCCKALRGAKMESFL